MVEKGKYQNSRGLKKEILNKMYEEAEPEYKKFNVRLMPGVDEKDIIGVRLPKLRKMAKEIAKSCASTWTIPVAIWKSAKFHKMR